MNPTEHKIPTNWYRVIIFFAIATAISNVFRFDVFDLKAELEKLPTWIYILSNVLLEGSGVLLGALIILPLLQKERKTAVSLFGTSKPKSLFMAVIPILILGVIGVQNRFEMNPHLYGIVASIGTLLYCIMEEYGWRGYLQEELKGIKPGLRYLIIGCIWYVWHLSFLSNSGIGNNLFFLSMLILGSWGLGQVADATKSIIASACFHMIIQIIMLNALFRDGINGTQKLIILIISVLIWIAILKKWSTEESQKQTK